METESFHERYYSANAIESVRKHFASNPVPAQLRLCYNLEYVYFRYSNPRFPDKEPQNFVFRDDLDYSKVLDESTISYLKNTTKFGCQHYTQLTYLNSIGVLDKITHINLELIPTQLLVDILQKMTSLKFITITWNNYDKYTDDINNAYVNIINNLPSWIENVKISNRQFKGDIKNLPVGIKTLEITSYYFDSSLDMISGQLETLILNCNKFNQPMDNLSPKLKRLEINSISFNQPMHNLPNLDVLILNTEKLELNHYNITLPKSLIEITLCPDSYYFKSKKFIKENLPKCKIILKTDRY